MLHLLLLLLLLLLLCCVCVQETSRYDAAIFERFQPTSVREVEALIGTMMYMGVVKAPTLEMYFTTDPTFRLPAVSTVFTRQRFRNLLSCLHLSNNDNFFPRGQDGHDKFFWSETIT